MRGLLAPNAAIKSYAGQLILEGSDHALKKSYFGKIMKSGYKNAPRVTGG
jgi:hypothetical protein